MGAKNLSAIQAIRKYCVDQCCCGDQEYVRECPGYLPLEGVECVLYPFRMGKNPNISEATRIKRQEQAKVQKLGFKNGTAT